mgnify:CR=1 FL=1
MFERNTIEEFRKWVSTLRYSYLWKRPSFRDDSDYFSLTLNYSGKKELFEILDRLKIVLNLLNPDLPNRIKDYPEYQQPCYVTLDGCKTFLWIENGKMSFSFSGKLRPYCVDEPDFVNCLGLEKLIDIHGLQDHVNRSMEVKPGTVTSTKYPFLKK